MLEGAKNKSMLADTAAVLGVEMADPSTTNYWSWVDALHMAMCTFSRMASATGDTRCSAAAAAFGVAAVAISPAAAGAFASGLGGSRSLDGAAGAGPSHDVS